MKKHKITLGAFLISLFLTIAITVSLTTTWDFYRFNNKFRNISKYEVVSSKLYELDGIVRSKFDGIIDEKKLNDAIKKGYMEGILDKNSRYMTIEEYREFLKNQHSQKLLFGAELVTDGGYIRVNRVFDTTTLEDGILLPGDLLVNINEEDITAINAETQLAKLGDFENEKVKFIVRRGVKDLVKELEVQYTDIPALQSDELEGGIKYLKINSFNEQSVKEFEKQIWQKSKETKAFIFDVRNLASNDIEIAANMLQTVLPQGLIVSLTYKDGQTENLFYCDGNQETKHPVVVLANRKTSGAAELFVQALRNYNKAVFVGEQTFGKGTMQKNFELRDGSGIELTVAKFNSPDGTNFQETGIAPDFAVTTTVEQEQKILSHNKDSDPQIQKACEILLTKIKNSKLD